MIGAQVVFKHWHDGAKMTGVALSEPIPGSPYDPITTVKVDVAGTLFRVPVTNILKTVPAEMAVNVPC